DTGCATIADANSSNGTFISGNSVTAATIGSTDIVEIGRTLFCVVPPLVASDHVVDERLQVPFNRPPRVLTAVPSLVFDLDAPPQRASDGHIPLGSSLVPLLGGGVLAYVMHSVDMLWFALLSPVMAVTSILERRWGGRRTYRRAERAYHDRL